MTEHRRSHRRARRRAVALGVAGVVAAALVVLVPFTRGRATAPPGRYTIAADTVLDTETGLVWQRAVPASSYTWAQALAYCEGLSLAGSSAWRLPSVKELQTLVDDRTYAPAIDTVAFPATPSTYFWSSSPDTYLPSFALVVDFDYGNTGTGDVTGPNDVRCVR